MHRGMASGTEHVESVLAVVHYCTLVQYAASLFGQSLMATVRFERVSATLAVIEERQEASNADIDQPGHLA
jgi:hypothetical protein